MVAAELNGFDTRVIFDILEPALKKYVRSFLNVVSKQNMTCAYTSVALTTIPTMALDT